MLYSAWQADVEFRASGPERGAGKFAIWLAKNGQETVGTSSIYTVGKFEGLSIVFDGYGGTVRLYSHHIWSGLTVAGWSD